MYHTIKNRNQNHYSIIVLFFGLSMMNLSAQEPEYDVLGSSLAVNNAFANLQEGDTKLALEFAEKAVQSNPTNHLAWFALGITRYFISQDMETISGKDSELNLSIAAFNNSIDINSRKLDSLTSLGTSVADQSLDWRGKCKKDLGDDDGAINDFEASIRIRPNYSALESLAWCKFRKGDYNSAIYFINRCEPYIKSEIEKGEESTYPFYYLRGSSQLNLKKYEAAIEDFSKGISLYPSSSDLWCQRGIAKYRMEQYQSAIEDFDQSIDLNQDEYCSWYFRGLSHGALGDNFSAISDYTEAIRIKPTSASAWNNRGWRRQVVGQVDEAKLDFQKARELNPDDQLSANNYNYLNRRIKTKYSSIHLITTGINNYQLFEELQPNELAVSGSYSIQNLYLRRNLLKSSAFLNDENATRSQVLKTLTSLSTNSAVQENDLVVFYFAGYGKIVNNSFSLCAYDYNGSPSDLISEPQIASLLDKSPAKFKICILELYSLEDANVYREPIEVKNIITNSRKAAFDIDADRLVSWFEERKKEQSGNLFIINYNKFAGQTSDNLLTKAVIAALDEGLSDLDQDKAITIQELKNYINRYFDERGIANSTTIKSTAKENLKVFIHSN